MRKLYLLSVIILCCLYCCPSMAQWDSTKLSTNRWNIGVTSSGDKAFFAGGFTYGSPIPFIYGSNRVDIFNGTSNQWTTNQLSKDRHSITTISNGNLVFFAGGQNFIAVSEAACVSAIDIYNIDSGKWTTAQLSEARANMAAVVAGSKVLFAGGVIDHYVDSYAVDIYDISTNQWTVTKLPYPYGGAGMKGMVIGNTVIFAAASFPVLLVYNVSTGQWNTKPIPLQRLYKAIDAVGTKIFVAGGARSDGSPLDRVDIYDLTTDQWSTAQLAQPRADIATISVGTKLFFAGGSNNSQVIDIYDMSVNQWTTAQLAVGRIGITTTTAGSKVFFAGSSTGSSIVDIYDLITNQWSATQLPTVRTSLRAVSASGKALFVEGGYGYPQNNRGNVDIYTTTISSTTRLDVSTNAVNIPATSSSTSFSITANTSWTVRSSETWLTPSPVSGTGNQVIALSSIANTAITSRTATITVSSAGLADRIITVTQVGAAPTLSVSAQRLSFPPEPSSPLSLTVTSNTSWSLISSASWLTSSVSSGTGTQPLSISASTNQSLSPRTATLTFTANGVQNQVITVTQSATPTTLAISVINSIPSAGSTTSVTITSNTSWSVASSQPWLVATPTSGTGIAVITLMASANSMIESRTATVTITADGVPSQVIIVLQAGIVVLGIPSLVQESIELYPNPASDHLYLRNLPSSFTLSLYDGIGKLVTQQIGTGPSHALSIESLPPGMYYIHIKDGQYSITKQFLKSI